MLVKTELPVEDATSTKDSFLASKQASGCMRNSFSPGYCDRKPMSAPMSTRPAVISSTVRRCPSLPLYATAVSREVVVDMRPNSTARATLHFKIEF